MKIGIDASNIRTGGCLTHLVELLRAAQPEKYGFEKVIVWGGSSTLAKLEKRPWLECQYQPELDRFNLVRRYWQKFKLTKLLNQGKFDLLFAPGCIYTGSFRPYAVMSQNMLPFEWKESMRYGMSKGLLRLVIFYVLQRHTFRNADGLIFLTSYANDVVMKSIKSVNGKTVIIPHGIAARFMMKPRVAKPRECYSFSTPFRILYVSTIDIYKHQWLVVEAVAKLRKEGLPVVLDLVGPAYKPALPRLMKALRTNDPENTIIRYLGAVNYENLVECYKGADLFVFASTCENLPIILMEAMSAGLPIACSNHGPMPEVLGEAGTYFDPDNPSSIGTAIKNMVESPELRMKAAQAAYAKAQKFSWERCAAETFEFLAKVAIGGQLELQAEQRRKNKETSLDPID
ncbi:MAG: glycosyltransferase family 1 protein [Candidatus Wallbacteria bacterium]|nr:glycosyltransferase family 1 protein [Candidatus Wallbacteria bacterium]